MSKVIAQDVVDQTVSNITTETNVAVLTIPSGTFPGVVKLEQTGRYQNNNVNGRTYTIRLYVGSSGGAGGTLIHTQLSASLTASTLGHATWQRWDLHAVDTDSLRSAERYGYGGPGSDDGTFGTLPATVGGFQTNSVDGLSLSGAVEIRITVQLSHTGVNHIFNSRGVWAVSVTEAVTATTYDVATETDTAGSFSPKIGYGVATETDTALTFLNENVLYTHALETDTARVFNIKRGYTFATETATAGTFVAAGGSAYALAQETDTAQSFGLKLGYTAAIETDTARAFGAKISYTPSTETDMAGTFTGGAALPDFLPPTGPTEARVLVGATRARVADAAVEAP